MTEREARAVAEYLGPVLPRLLHWTRPLEMLYVLRLHGYNVPHLVRLAKLKKGRGK